MGFGMGIGMFNIMFVLVFGIVIVMFIVTAVKGIGTWHKNNNSPRLTVEATVVSKRQNTSVHLLRHLSGGQRRPDGAARQRTGVRSDGGG